MLQATCHAMGYRPWRMLQGVGPVLHGMDSYAMMLQAQAQALDQFLTEKNAKSPLQNEEVVVDVSSSPVKVAMV